MKSKNDEVKKLVSQVGGFYQDAVDKSPQMKRGIVWCTVCGRKERVDAVHCLKHGWKMCCGLTMTLDSPEERGVKND